LPPIAEAHYVSADLVTLYDPYRSWMAIPELTALAGVLYFAIMSYREQVLARREAGLRADWDGLFGLGLALAVAVGVTSLVPTPAWMVLGGPSRVVEGPVEEARYGKTPSGVMTLDLVVEGVAVHLEDEGREAEMIAIPAELGGPVRRGDHVRVSLHAHRVLKFERRIDDGTRGAELSPTGPFVGLAKIGE
jgi:hypothetical protein